LKAVAELVENSIDARAKTIVITRGKDKGQHYLRVKDDGEGVRRNADGEPDFHYVATHVCDSIKRRLKTQGTQGLQGEFGIGLLSFWTLGEDLLLTSAGDDGRAWQMHLRKGDPSYRITLRPALFPRFRLRGPQQVLKLRYICRLFAKELVLKNFVGIPQNQLLERLLELTLYTEENLR